MLIRSPRPLNGPKTLSRPSLLIVIDKHAVIPTCDWLSDTGSGKDQVSTVLD